MFTNYNDLGVILKEDKGNCIIIPKYHFGFEWEL